MSDAANTVGRLVRLLALVDEQAAREAGARSPDVTFADLGVGSFALFSLLTRIEQAFGIAWSDDVPAEALQSIATLAAYLEGDLAVGSAERPTV